MSNAGPVFEGVLGGAFGASRTGIRHRASGTPCQDAYGIHAGAIAGVPHIVMAVADGHGDPSHDLSQYGAALAVQAAMEQAHASLMSTDCRDADAGAMRTLRREYPRLVSRRWRQLVNEDYCNRFGGNESGQGSEDTYVGRYGTTLLAAIVFPHVILVAQLGDGDIVFLHNNGDIVRPISSDPSLLGMATHSLCSEGAGSLWQTGLIRAPDGGLLLLATDGLSDAYDTESGVLAFSKNVRDILSQHGMAKVASLLPWWIDDKYSKASGDDVTIVFADVMATPEPRQPTESISGSDLSQGNEKEQAQNDA